MECTRDSLRIIERKGNPLAGASVVTEQPVCQANVGKKTYRSCGKKMVIKSAYSYECPLHGIMY